MKLKLIDRMQEQARIFGKMNRCTQTQEECAELTKELCKYQRIDNNDETCNANIVATLENIAEEIADVEICTCQLKHLFDIKNKVENIKEQKLLRTEQRLIEAGKIPGKIMIETEVDSDLLRKIMSGETNDTDKQDYLLFNQRNHIV